MTPPFVEASIRWVLFVLAVLALGDGARRAARLEVATGLGRVGWAFALGIGLWSWLALTGVVLVRSFELGFWAGAGLAAAGAVGLVRERARGRGAAPGSGTAPTPAGPTPGAPEAPAGPAAEEHLRRWRWATGLGLGVLGALLVVDGFRPFELWDDRGFWMLKARVLLEEGTILGESFHSPVRIHPLANRPLLVPTTAALAGRAVGGWYDAWVRAFLPLHALALLLVLADAALRRPPVGRGLAVLAALATMPLLHHTAASGLADVPFALYAAAAGALVAGAELSQRRAVLTLAFLLALLPMTKNEGAPLAALLLGAAALGHGWRRAAVVAAWTAGLALPWLVARWLLPAGFDDSLVASLTPDRLAAGLTTQLPRVLAKLGHLLTSPQDLGLGVAVVLLAGVAAGRSALRGRSGRLLAVVLAQLGVYLLILLTHPDPDVDPIQSALPRLLLQLLPLAGLAVLLAPADEPSPVAQGVTRPGA